MSGSYYEISIARFEPMSVVPSNHTPQANTFLKLTSLTNEISQHLFAQPVPNLAIQSVKLLGCREMMAQPHKHRLQSTTEN